MLWHEYSGYCDSLNVVGQSYNLCLLCTEKFLPMNIHIVVDHILM